jgi:uncharacterized membrane protein
MGVCLIWSFQAAAAQRVGPQGKVRVICLGDVVDQYGGYNSFTVVDYDPAIQPTFVPSRSDYVGGRDVAVRNMRIYMPRTREKLVDGYDLILMSDADDDVFKPEWISWMSGSVEIDGLGLLWLGSIVHTGSADFNWEGTTLAPILPATQAPGQYFINGAFRVSILDGDEALTQSLPWESSPPLANVNTQVPKRGSLEWAIVKGTMGSYPLLTFWEIGKGATLNFASKFPAGVEPWAKGWNLFPQAMMYMVYRVADKVLPRDPYLFEEVMNEFIEFAQMSSLVGSMLDWVEKFGGNPRSLRDRLEEVDDTKARAEEAYLGGSFEEALAILHEGEAQQVSIREAVNKAKDEALFWVYVTEWCSLMGTLMISSYVLWALMVRRALYREAGVSRLQFRAE